MDVLAQFPTRRSLVSHIQNIKNMNSVSDPDAFEHDLWVKWARARRGFRFVTVFHALLAKAEVTKTTTYGDLANTIDLGSNNELNQLIMHIGKLCKNNGWPPYPVLIKNQKTGKVGQGFFKFYADSIGPNFETNEEQTRFETICEEQCFNTPIPNQIAVLCRLAEYVHLNFGV